MTWILFFSFIWTSAQIGRVDILLNPMVTTKRLWEVSTNAQAVNLSLPADTVIKRDPTNETIIWLSGISRGRVFSKNKYLESILVPVEHVSTVEKEYICEFNL